MVFLIIYGNRRPAQLPFVLLIKKQTVIFRNHMMHAGIMIKNQQTWKMQENIENIEILKKFLKNNRFSRKQS